MVFFGSRVRVGTLSITGWGFCEASGCSGNGDLLLDLVFVVVTVFSGSCSCFEGLIVVSRTEDYQSTHYLFENDKGRENAEMRHVQ